MKDFSQILEIIQAQLHDLSVERRLDPMLRRHLDIALVLIQEAAIGIRHPGCYRSAEDLVQAHTEFPTRCVPQFIRRSNRGRKGSRL
jgi:hypothetical protein